MNDHPAVAHPDDAARAQLEFLLWMRAPHLSRLEVQARLGEGAAAQALLAASSVRIFGEGEAADRLLELLELAGVGRRARGTSGDHAEVEGADLNVYCPDAFDETFARHLNRISIRAAVPVVFYRTRGLELECGPLVTPPDTSCYECFAVRRAALLSPLERIWLDRTERVGALRFPMAVEFLALDILRFLARLGEPVLQGKLWRLSLQTGETAIHTLLRIPRCPACGPIAELPPVRIWSAGA